MKTIPSVILITVVGMIAVGTPAEADQITVTNSTATAIFKIYAWPTEFAARTFNILGAPLFPTSSAEIDVDNSYGDCQFTIEYDPNDPADLKKRNRTVKPLTTLEVNLCAAKGKITLSD